MSTANRSIHRRERVSGEKDVRHILRKYKLTKSPSQPNTRGDGNCFLYAIMDQLKYINRLKGLKYLNAKSLRRKIVGYLHHCLLSEFIVWDDSARGTVNEWTQKMSR